MFLMHSALSEDSPSRASLGGLRLDRLEMPLEKTEGGAIG
jgi:hypothetical protein